MTASIDSQKTQSSESAARNTRAPVQPQAVAAAYTQSQNSGSNGEPPWELVEKYLPLVKSIVARMNTHFPSKIDAEDLYSIGVKGLIMAISKFDHSKKKSFASYAILRIRGAILDELRRIDCMPRSNRSKAKELRKQVNEMEARLRRPVSEEEIRKELGLNKKEYAKLMQQVQPITHVTLDQSPDPEESKGPTIADAISDPTEMNSRETAENKEMFDLLRTRIKDLPDVPQRVLVMYYYEEMNFAEIGEVMGLTESRICQIHSQGVSGLRNYLESAMNR